MLNPNTEENQAKDTIPSGHYGRSLLDEVLTPLMSLDVNLPAVGYKHQIPPLVKESLPTDATFIDSRTSLALNQHLHGGCQKVGPKVAKFLDR